MKSKYFFITVFLFLSSLFAVEARAIQTIRFATLAPEGSTWMNAMRAIDADLRKETNEQVGIKLYPNMSMGDETDVIRKIRLGQINGGGFTGFGLGEILPEIRVLELPYMFKNEQEIDYAVGKLTPMLSAKLADKGFILLGWADVGWIYFMAQKPVATPSDLKHLNVWMWQGDPLAKAFYEELGKTPVSLSVTDVRLSLQTGMIDAVYGSPLTTLVLQWFTKLKYISDVPFTNAIGAVLIDKKTFESLSEPHRKALLDISSRHLKDLLAKTRQDNRDAYERLQKEGLQPVISTPAQRAEMEAIGLKVHERLAGNLYPRGLLDMLRGAVTECRAEQGKPKPK